MGKGGSTFCCRPLITHQQGQSGLSTVGEAHLLAVDWLGWVCCLLDKLEVVNLEPVLSGQLRLHQEKV